MTIALLDTTYPSDSTNLVSDLGAAERETRSTVNDLISSFGGTVTSITLSSGQTSLSLSSVIGSIIIVEISNTVACTLKTITSTGTSQIIVLKFLSGDVTVANSASIVLNGAGEFTDFVTEAGDALMLYSNGSVFKEITRLVVG